MKSRMGVMGIRHSPDNWRPRVGERVEVPWDDGKTYGGVIVSVKCRFAVINFDDGDSQEIELTRLVKSSPPRVTSQPTVQCEMGESGDSDDEGDLDEGTVVQEGDGDVRFNPPPKGSRGMHHYPISWDKSGTHFNTWAAPDGNDVNISPAGNDLILMLKRAKNKAVHFYGWWRHTKFLRDDGNGRQIGSQFPGWAVDIFARVEFTDGTKKELAVESITYEKGPGQYNDPRDVMHSLNSDICAAIRKWFFTALRGDAETVRQLVLRAKSPIIEVPSLEWLDRLILTLTHTRETALMAGGERSVVIHTGFDKDPNIVLRMNFTEMAVMLAETQSRVPNLYQGTMIEQVVESGGAKGVKAKELKFTADPSHVATLQDRLRVLNKQVKTNPAAKREARQIRATLRRMGHNGGARESAGD